MPISMVYADHCTRTAIARWLSLPPTTTSRHCRPTHRVPLLELLDQHLHLRPYLVQWWSFNSLSLLIHNLSFLSITYASSVMKNFHLFRSPSLTHELSSWKSKELRHYLLLRFINRSMMCSWPLEARSWQRKARWGNGMARWGDVIGGLTVATESNGNIGLITTTQRWRGERSLCYIHILSGHTPNTI